jgi:nitrogenase molybdenum-iron protein alpha chain
LFFFQEGYGAHHRDEIPIHVAPVFCEGFKTKIWASGFDAAYHAILTQAVKPPEKKSNTVNVINFFVSARKQITAISAEFVVVPLFLTSNTSIDELSRLSESVATVSTCGTWGPIWGTAFRNSMAFPM